MSSVTMISAIGRALSDAFEADPRVVAVGERAFGPSGAVGATRGLRERFGAERFVDLPSCDAMLVQTSIGLALGGARPVCELSGPGFAMAAVDPMVQEAGRARFRTGGEFCCPVALRIPCGGGVRGGPDLSLDPATFFCHAPGLTVLSPSTPADAYSMVRFAARADDPVVVLEPRVLYRLRGEPGVDGTDSGPPRACVRRDGSDAALIGWGGMMPVCERAAQLAAKIGIECTVVDLRSLVPLDRETLVAQVRRTGRAVVVDAAPRTASYAAEVCATIAEDAIEYLEAPVVRVAGLDAPVPFTHEDVHRPDAESVLAAIERVVDF